MLVDFLEGDIDRPVVVGAVYNGRGQQDAAHNQIGSGGAGATGNASAWFDGNAHAAVFTGFKSQVLNQSQSGTGGYQQLRLDDTPGQGRAQASTTQHAYIERYNRTVRYAWLATTLFDSIEQVQDKATAWLWMYNHERPSMALGGITPMQRLAMAV